MIAMLMTSEPSRDLSRQITLAARNLMATREDGRGFRINVPVLYPSGSGCSVEIIPNGDVVFVSDIGLGHWEADYGGASEHYDKQARRAAHRFGVGYDGYSIFGLRIAIDRLEGAIVSVANASVQAASLAILKAAEDKERRTNDAVFDRLKSVFGTARISKVEDIPGQRDTWAAHNVVNFPTGQKAVFEFVSPHQSSISSKFLMFSDLAGSGGALSLNTVTRNIATLGSRGAMLSDVSNLIELTAENEQYERFAHRLIAA